MSTENNEILEGITSDEPVSAVEETPISVEAIPSMDDFKEELNNSFKTIKEGDILTGTVIGISETEVTLDLGYYTEGYIKLEELSNDPSFSIKADITMGEEISAIYLREDHRNGNLVLSRKRATDILAWDELVAGMESKQVYTVKIAQTVNGGVVTYLKGIRAFIPASQLSITYVEDLAAWVGKEINVIIVTASKDDQKLVLSGKEVEKDLSIKDKNSKISKLQVGIVTTGTVEKITPYGAFIQIGDGLSGLVHISQICGKRIKSPNEVIKEGQEVTVKIIDVKDGKISLSMKAVEEEAEVVEDVEATLSTYSTGEEATTGLGALLKNFKLN